MRTKLKVSKNQLESIVESLEKEKPLGLIPLAEAVAKTSWAIKHKPKPVTKGIALARIKEFNLKKKRKKKTSGKIGKPSVIKLQAAIKQKCLECSNYQASEVRNCPISNCPLFNVRPYK